MENSDVAATHELIVYFIYAQIKIPIWIIAPTLISRVISYASNNMILGDLFDIAAYEFRVIFFFKLN